jgi:hypothetical protein
MVKTVVHWADPRADGEARKHLYILRIHALVKPRSASCGVGDENELITRMLEWAENNLVSPRSPAKLTMESSSLHFTQPLVLVG